jgi:hypothetical protein
VFQKRELFRLGSCITSACQRHSRIERVPPDDTLHAFCLTIARPNIGMLDNIHYYSPSNVDSARVRRSDRSCPSYV